jgi:hypothetical protein
MESLVSLLSQWRECVTKGVPVEFECRVRLCSLLDKGSHGVSLKYWTYLLSYFSSSSHCMEPVEESYMVAYWKLDDPDYRLRARFYPHRTEPIMERVSQAHVYPSVFVQVESPLFGPVNLKFAMKEEHPAEFQLLLHQPPQKIKLCQRTTYRLKDGSVSYMLTKAAFGVTKAKAAQAPCRYEVEVEWSNECEMKSEMVLEMAKDMAIRVPPNMMLLHRFVQHAKKDNDHGAEDECLLDIHKG